MTSRGDPYAPMATEDALPRGASVLQLSCLAAALLVCLPSLQLISSIWSRSEFYGHGYLIPACSLGFVIYSRARLRELLAAALPPRLGPLWVLGVASFQALAVLGDVVFAAGLSVTLVLASVGYAIGGRVLLSELRLPLGLLVFMVPPPGFVMSRLLISLKLFVTEIAVGMMQAAGVTVAAQGNQILVPGHALFVADACSGLTSIVTLIPLSVVVGCFLCPGVWRKVVLVASVVPLALAANILRVTGTVLLVSYVGGDFAEGLLHESFGMLTYVLGTLSLVGIARLLG